MQKIVLFIIAMVIIASCQKDRDAVKVDYAIQGFGAPYSVSYLNKEGSTVTTTVTPKGISDEWKISFLADPGTPLYLYVKSQEDISGSMSFSLSLKIEGKYYQQAKDYDGAIQINGQTFHEIKRSGVVPF